MSISQKIFLPLPELQMVSYLGSWLWHWNSHSALLKKIYIYNPASMTSITSGPQKSKCRSWGSTMPQGAALSPLLCNSYILYEYQVLEEVLNHYITTFRSFLKNINLQPSVSKSIATLSSTWTKEVKIQPNILDINPI